MWLKKEKRILPLLGAQTLSELATSVVSYSLILWAYGQTGAAFDISLLSVAAYLPYILGSLFSGALIDRLHQKTILIACDTLSAVGTAALLLLFLSGNLSVGWIVLLNAVSGLGNAFHVPAFHALMGRAASDRGDSRLSGLLSFSSALVTAFSTFFATLLYTAVGLVFVFIFDLLVYALAVGVLLKSQAAAENRPAMGRGAFPQGIWAQAREGYTFLFRHSGLLWIILSMCLMNFFSRLTYENILPAMLLSRSGNNEAILAAVNLTIGLGGVAGGILVSTRRIRGDRVRLLYASAAVSFLFGDLLMAFGRGPALWVPAALAASVPIPFLTAAQQSILYATVPQTVMGRVFAARNAVQFSAIPLGILLGGLLADGVFTPLARSGGPAAELIRRCFGDTDGSGMALMFLCTGLLGALLCAAAYRSRGICLLRRELAEQGVSVDTGREGFR